MFKITKNKIVPESAFNGNDPIYKNVRKYYYYQ